MRRRVIGFVAALALAAWATGSLTQAAIFSYTVHATGPSEFPANGSPGIADGTIVYDSVAHTLGLDIAFSGLTGTTTASHIHAPTATSGVGTEAQASAAQNAGVATTLPSFTGFPLGVTNGVFANVLDLTQSSSWNPAYVTANGGTNAGAEAAFAMALADGKAYWNIHTSTFGGGEIRGFATPIPEPATLVLLASAALGLFSIRRRPA